MFLTVVDWVYLFCKMVSSTFQAYQQHKIYIMEFLWSLSTISFCLYITFQKLTLSENTFWLRSSYVLLSWFIPVFLNVLINSASFSLRNAFLNSNFLISNLDDKLYEWIYIIDFLSRGIYWRPIMCLELFIGTGEIANSKQIKRQMTFQVNQKILYVIVAKKVFK